MDRLKIIVLAVVALLGLAGSTVGSAAAKHSQQTYRDPVSYCQEVGTVDAPGRNYRGPQAWPAALRAAQLGSDQKDSLSWRCMDGTVWVCAGFSTTSCMKAPSANPQQWAYLLRDPQNINFCRSRPHDECVGGTHCIVGCVGGRPRINGPSAPTDHRGYDRSEWKPVGR